MSADEIENMLKDGAAKRLGIGSRRACYALPGGRLCVKCYRSDGEIAEGKHPGRTPFKPLAPSVAREICRCRFDERRNTCCQEYAYWLELRERLPAELFAVFPLTMELVLLPTRGWCVVEELVENADGTPAKGFGHVWMETMLDAAGRERLLSKLEELSDALVRHAVRIYDPQNILVQNGADGTVRLRITDFEPATRAMIPLDRIAPALVRLKVRRRMARFRRLFHIRRFETA